MMRPIKTVSSDSPVFDGNEAVVWIVNMTSHSADARLKNIAPGVLYTFVFVQNAAGGNTFAWPKGAINPPPINTRPNGTTTANFIGKGGGQIASNASATWF